MKALILGLALIFGGSAYAGDFDLTSNQVKGFTATGIQYKELRCWGTSAANRVCCLQYQLTDASDNLDPNGSKDVCLEFQDTSESMAELTGAEKSALGDLVKRMACGNEGGCQ